MSLSKQNYRLEGIDVALDINKYVVISGSAEARKKAALSKSEAFDLTTRELRCPYCGYLVLKLFSDMRTGHLESKCPKCKKISQYNTAYFKREKSKTR